MQKATTAQPDEFFGTILCLYDLTDNVVNAIGATPTTDRAAQLELAAPIIEQSNHSIDTLCRIVTEIERSGMPLDEQRKAALEKAFQDVFAVIAKLHERRNS